MRPLRRVATASALLALALSGCNREPAESDPPQQAVPVHSEEQQLQLFFPAGDGHLRPEARPAGESEKGVEAIRAVLQALLAGPQSESLHAPMPEGTSVGSIRLSTLGVAYVDFATPDGTGRPRWGSRQEILAAYSVIHSICANVSGVESVAFLWDGEQPPTFAGQLDTRMPLKPDPRWVTTRTVPPAEAAETSAGP